MGPEGPPTDYYDEGSQSVACYDAVTAANDSAIRGDVAFYAALGARSYLELGCGTGRVSHALAAMGREVTGLDISEPMLRLARAKGAGPTFLHGDMMDVRLEKRFEAVIAPFFGFAHVPPERRQDALLNMAAHLKPGGVIALHMPTEQALRTPAHDRPLARAGDVTLYMPRIEQTAPRFDYYAEYRTPEGISVERLTYWLGPVDAPGLKRRRRPFSPGTEMHLLRRDRAASAEARR